MELEARLADLAKVVKDHREVLLTEEAAKNALVMPFLQHLGYNVFNPSEVIPEFTCDVGTKKGEKVDYAISIDDSITMLVECKPANSELNLKHASQLFRYFSVTDARIAVLTNGVIYKFYSDTNSPNKMDDNPFFIFNLEDFRKNHVRTLGKFTKNDFDIEKIVDEAGHLKLQGQVRAALAREFEDPSDDFVKLIASRVHDGRVTSNIKDSLKSIIVASLNAVIVDRVHDRLNSALNASNPSDFDESHESPSEIETTQDEIDGFNIVRAIAGRKVDPSRIVMRDAKSYCAILLDDNNRKTIARMHFNSSSVRYFGTFVDKSEAKHPVSDPIAIYQFEQEILARISELGG